MRKRQVFVLENDIARRAAIEAIRTAPAGFVVEVKPRLRTMPQNATYHSIVTAVGDQAVIQGRTYGRDTWHEHFKRQFFGLEFTEMREGKILERAPSSAWRDRRHFAEYIQYVEAEAAALGVRVPAPRALSWYGEG